jgi:hypothetical protein
VFFSDKLGVILFEAKSFCFLPQAVLVKERSTWLNGYKGQIATTFNIGKMT